MNHQRFLHAIHHPVIIINLPLVANQAMETSITSIATRLPVIQEEVRNQPIASSIFFYYSTASTKSPLQYLKEVQNTLLLVSLTLMSLITFFLFRIYGEAAHCAIFLKETFHLARSSFAHVELVILHTFYSYTFLYKNFFHIQRAKSKSDKKNKPKASKYILLKRMPGLATNKGTLRGVQYNTVITPDGLSIQTEAGWSLILKVIIVFLLICLFYILISTRFRKKLWHVG